MPLYQNIPGLVGGWASAQYSHAQTILGSKIDDYATALDFISPGGYTLSGMARMNKGKGRVTSSGVGQAFANIGAGTGVSIIDNPLTESWYIACRGCVALTPGATTLMYVAAVNGTASGVTALFLDGSVSTTKFKIMTNNGALLVVNFAATIGVDILLGVDYDFALAYDAQAQVLTAYLNQGLQATQANVSQVAATAASILHYQQNQTGVFEVDDLFFAFKR